MSNANSYPHARWSLLPGLTSLLVLSALPLGCASSNPSSMDGSGAGGSGGASACQQATALDRSCSTDADCIAVVHETSCCGGLAWIGIRVTEQQTFNTLEAACMAGYPGCGCFDGHDNADDGSRIASGASAAAGCQAGLCKSYSPACGHACGAGQACQTCMDSSTGTTTSACASRCMDATMCTDATVPRCNRGPTIGLCAPASAACDLPG